MGKNGVELVEDHVEFGERSGPADGPLPAVTGGDQVGQHRDHDDHAAHDFLEEGG